MRRLRIVIGGLMLILGTLIPALSADALWEAAHPAEVVVRTSSELVAALVESTDGETVFLEPGRYEPVTIQGMHLASRLTITSQNPADPAVVEAPFQILGSSGIVIDSLTIEIMSPEVSRGMEILDSTRIVLRNVAVRGGVETDGADAGLYYGQGVRVNDSSAILIERARLEQLANGLTIGRVRDVAIIDSEISHIRRDGLVLRDIEEGTIARNFIHSFYPLSGDDHPDMIQFVAREESEWGIRGLSIVGNVFSQGSGRFVQTIFGRMELEDRPDIASRIEWTDIVIAENLIVNRQVNGIYLADVEGAIIVRNTLLPSPNTGISQSPFDGPRIKLPSESRQASDNMVHSNVLFGESDTYFSSAEYLDDAIGENVFVSPDPSSSAFYAVVFPHLHNVWLDSAESIPDASVSPLGRSLVPHGFGFSYPPVAAVGPFVDMIGSVFVEDAESLGRLGVTLGCDPPVNVQYCPGASLTRGQMAALLARASELEPVVGHVFVDTAGSQFGPSISAIAEAGISIGCNPPANTRYCPDDVVTRGQMAAFLARAFNLDAESHESFVDVNTSVFSHDIRRLVASGVARGCDPPANTRFCPDEPVTRGQVAAFINRAIAAQSQ